MKMAVSFMTILTWFLLLISIIKQSSSTRTLSNPTPTHHHHNHNKITFLMRDVFNITQPSYKPSTKSNHLPFSKPVGFFPPNGGIPLAETNPSVPATQSLDLSWIGLSFPSRATLQELEFGVVTPIDEEIFLPYGSKFLGKAQGMHVASSEDGSSHMMALTAIFGNDEVKSGLRFFGVRRSDVHESHIAVIGGIGKFQSANGYATVKALKGPIKLLKFSVYLS
ncbi:hypothetical protein UlMin_025732 [Ulmus minor]